MTPCPQRLEPHDLVLDFYAVQGGFLVAAEGEGWSAASPLTLTADETATLAASGERFRHGHILEEGAAIRVGTFLYDRVIRDGIEALFLEARGAARSLSVPLRLVLRFPAASEIEEIPWELLHDGRRFLALDPWTPLVRHIRLPQPAADLAVEPPLRILFTAADTARDEDSDERSAADSSGRTAGGLHLEEEARALRQALAGAGGRVQLEVVEGMACDRPLTLRRLEGLFVRARAQGRPFHVWHHAGHGGIRRGPSGLEFVLLLHGDDGRSSPVPGRSLSRTLASAGDLKLAVLNLCRSGSTIGLSTELAQLNVPAVVGFCTTVLDPAAVEFSRAFYASLTKVPLDLSLTCARQAMADQRWPLQWALPILHCRSRGQLALLRSSAPARSQHPFPDIRRNFKELRAAGRGPGGATAPASGSVGHSERRRPHRSAVETSELSDLASLGVTDAMREEVRGWLLELRQAVQDRPDRSEAEP